MHYLEGERSGSEERRQLMQVLLGWYRCRTETEYKVSLAVRSGLEKAVVVCSEEGHTARAGQESPAASMVAPGIVAVVAPSCSKFGLLDARISLRGRRKARSSQRSFFHARSLVSQQLLDRRFAIPSDVRSLRAV